MKETLGNILIVDDEQGYRAIHRSLLDKSRFHINDVFEAANGIDAIDIMSRNRIDLIFTEIHMPVMNGIQFLNIIHNQQQFKDIPAIAVTAEKDEKLTNMLSLWGHGYIQKPIELGILEQQIAKFYGSSSQYYLHG